MDVLEGIKVIDLTMWAFVPSAGGVLAHWGADVIKVESPRNPDPMRLLGGTLEPGDASWYFKHYSRGKRAITLDLGSDDGRALLYKLVEGADVFLTSYLPDTRKKLGFDVDDIRKVNPDIIYARGSGQGPKGPENGRGGYDGITWWGRGTLAQSTMDVTGVDFPTGMIGHGDGMSGMTLAGGICAAIAKRALTGKTSVVDGSLMGTAIWFNGPAIITSGLGISMPIATGTREDRHPTGNIYRTKDDRFISFSMLGDDDRDWVDFCEHMGRPDMATDPKWLTTADRYANAREAVQIFDAIFAGKTFEEWKKVLVTTRGAWAPIQKPVEIFDDPQTVANGFLRPVDYPAGPMRLPVPPVLFDEEAGDVPPAPDFGQHTDEVLTEIGVSAEELARLRSTGVIL
jgi:crotonobetainyl-CoA:carnitine CoA-transferase CaiB-like acyl-CoA transferase